MRARALPLLACLLALSLIPAAAPAGDYKPSILLVVFDTTRADAVSAYGSVRDTTPELDRLASMGLRYERAFANAPWTLPSHVTLFTSLLLHQHAVGTRGIALPATIPTLAEMLQAAGYETASFSENPFVSEMCNMMRGFEHRDNNQRTTYNVDLRVPNTGGYHVGQRVEAWVKQRKDKRPFFVFVNVMNAHAPYGETERARLPVGMTLSDALRIDRDVNKRICSALPPAGEIEALKALYHDGVNADDAKLKVILDTLSAAKLTDDLVVIVTSDHGEHFGEHRLMEHNFSVRNALLHVPLIISGLRGAQPAVVQDPVQLADIMPTILGWIGVAPPPGIVGRALPMTSTAHPSPVAIAAHYTEPDNVLTTGSEPEWLLRAKAKTNVTRKVCTADDRVYGDLLSIIRYPYKLIWYERHPSQLYDLSKDPLEEVDLAATRKDIVARFRTDVQSFRQKRTKVAVPAPTLSAEAQERMRVLGYLDAPPTHTAAPAQAPKK